ncbi:PAAR domain-containing protein [Wolbachia endosymbiont (group B) of Catoptria pinella]|uniref:hypothetical protein n=1 Tax=Wolbachia endosymbiont (group B) of Catoptria pinella TaxID=2953993 RepID=UPI0022272AF8|nr:hypothetical protein [Wolbachia endosymbiont (group B) of Catoptria pinella]
MGKAIVCVGDNCTGIPVHVCMSGSEDVFVNSRSVCRRYRLASQQKNYKNCSSCIIKLKNTSNSHFV